MTERKPERKRRVELKRQWQWQDRRMNACGKFVIVLAVAFLWASVIATTITFPLDFWLINPSARIRYGMWTLCQDLTTPNGGFLCYSFYDNYTQNSLTSTKYETNWLSFSRIYFLLVFRLLQGFSGTPMWNVGFLNNRALSGFDQPFVLLQIFVSLFNRFDFSCSREY